MKALLLIEGGSITVDACLNNGLEFGIVLSTRKNQD